MVRNSDCGASGEAVVLVKGEKMKSDEEGKNAASVKGSDEWR